MSEVFTQGHCEILLGIGLGTLLAAQNVLSAPAPRDHLENPE